jgi:Holliday junction DNA helicase RuvB
MREDYLSSENNSSSKDKEFENILRPKSFGDFLGQEQIISNVKVFVKAAKQRSEPLDHVILHGPPGLGKTTLSHIISNELSTNLKVTSGPVLEKAADLAGLLTNLEEGDVLFIDEIHRLNKVIEEYLYSAMEDFKIDLMIDSGPSARSVQIKLNPFTLIGATTRSGLLSAPLRSRFSINFRLEYYSKDILEKIVNRSAEILDIPVDSKAAKEIAKRSRGTPRILNNLLRRVRDFAEVEGNGKITHDISIKSLDALKIDKKGLDEMDNKIIDAIVNKFNGGPVGIKTIATACGEEANTIEEVYEPFLVQEGYIKRTQKGRVATEISYNHLGINPKGGFQNSIFE